MKRPGPHRSFLIDVEGVLVRDKAYQALPGAVDWLAEVAARGVPFCLVSNNTTMPSWQQVAALRAAGFDLKQEQQVGALDEGVRWLRERGRQSILWLGAPDMEGFWQDEGFQTDDPESCQSVVLGANPDLPTGRLALAMPALLDRGADLVCLHRNRYYLDAKGDRRLGPGVWAAALEALGGPGKVVTVGKPAKRIYHEGLKRVGTAPSDTLFISDDPPADLVTAGRLGMRTAFVLTGKHPDHGVLSQLEETDWPDLICAGLSDIDIPEVETP